MIYYIYLSYIYIYIYLFIIYSLFIHSLFIHSLAPFLSIPFLSLVVVLCDVGVDVVLGPPNRASIRTQRVIPKVVKMETIVIPCSLKRVLILSPSVPVSLSKNFMIDSLI